MFGTKTLKRPYICSLIKVQLRHLVHCIDESFFKKVENFVVKLSYILLKWIRQFGARGDGVLILEHPER